jgi:hypothetical protein
MAVQKLHPTDPPPLQVTVSVIIVSWNGRCWLEKCLPALQTQTYRDFEIVVVDNGSLDGTSHWLASSWPEILVLEQPVNLGFAEANNIAIRSTSSQLIVTLNNDTLPDADWLQQLVGASSFPGIGMVASHIVRWSQPEMIDSAGIEVDRSGIAWNRGWGQPVATAPGSGEVFGPSAAAALYRREMLNEIGLFDESFFSFYEDVDLAWRAQRAGWRCRYVSTARVLHWHSATAGKSPGLKSYLLGRNKIWTVLKNYAWPELLWALPLIAFYDCLAVGYQLFRWRNAAGLKGRLNALLKAPQVLSRRPPGRTRVTLAPPKRPWTVFSG